MEGSAPEELEHDCLSCLPRLPARPLQVEQELSRGCRGPPDSQARPSPQLQCSSAKRSSLPAQPGSPRARSQEHRANLHPELNGTAPDMGFLKWAAGRPCACPRKAVSRLWP